MLKGPKVNHEVLHNEEFLMNYHNLCAFQLDLILQKGCCFDPDWKSGLNFQPQLWSSKVNFYTGFLSIRNDKGPNTNYVVYHKITYSNL